MHSVSHGATLLTPQMEDWVGVEACHKQTLGCIMQNFVPQECDSVSAVSETVVVLPTAEPREVAAMLALPDDTSGMPEMDQYNLQVMAEQSHTKHGTDVIPSSYRSRGWFWWTSQLEKFLWRPSDQLAKQLHEARETVGLNDARAAGKLVIGMHVRQGDACVDAERSGRTCSSLAAYMKHAEKLRTESGADTILLATDSEKVFDETKNYPEFTFLKMEESLKLQRQIEAELNDPQLWAWDAKLATLRHKTRQDVTQLVAHASSVDMMLLSEADMFVGKFTSNFFRTAYELSAGECNCARPFTSLDSPWCFDYGVRAGKGENGNFPC